MCRAGWWWRVIATTVLTALFLLGMTNRDLYAQDSGEQLDDFAADTMQVGDQLDRNGTLRHQSPGAYDAYRDAAFVPGELLVGFHNNDLHALSTGAAAVTAAAVEQLDLRGMAYSAAGSDVTGYVVRVPTGAEWTTMEQLIQDPSVAFAVPNWIVYAADDTVSAAELDETVAAPETPFAVNDPRYVSEQWYLQRINASRSWSIAYGSDGFGGGFTEVQVAIIDSGIDVNHPEFRSRLLAGQNYVSPGSPPDDDFGHGTHVAGLIGAVANNAAGIAGVAPKVRIDPRKVLNSQGTGSISNVSNAIRDAADAGADVINLSLESPVPNVVMEAAVQYAFDQGVLLIAASGNQGITTVSWPAHYDEVVAVAATTYNDARASYSNSGAQIEIAAPGGERNQSIISTWPGGVRCRDINAAPPESDYCTSEGTSMAAAIVSGGAALIKSVRPSLTAAGIRQLLRDTAQPLNEPITFVGSGRLDMQAALREIMPATLKLSTTTFARELVLGSLPYTVTLRMDNPSHQAFNWEATLLSGQSFVEFHEAISNTATGTLRYGDPVYLTLTISPTQLLTGSHAATLQIDAIKADNTRLTHFVDLSVLMRPPGNLLLYYFPLVLYGDRTSVSTTDYQWETPVEPNDRVVHGMANNSNIGIALPFPFTLRNREYEDARLYSDGFLRFPDTSVGNNLPNRCLPNLSEPAQAIYGWWADLDPSAQNARVSTFQPTVDRFVIEFDSVPSAPGITPAYQVSFQIVLYANGDIRLNYGEALGLTPNAPDVTVGVKARDGLFFNQVACKDGAMEVGYLPQSLQSLLFKAQGDIY